MANHSKLRVYQPKELPIIGYIILIALGGTSLFYLVPSVIRNTLDLLGETTDET